ncbi:MAG: hypothetical protein GY804_05475 [Alphaproteobacteria bacterium]|nr:hypothetical protein [Alphaproteobacteria bacterium]
MDINPVTVIAEVLSFGIFVWILSKLLYKPILNAMNERESIIASRLDEAREQAENARKEVSVYRQKNEEFDRQVESMLAEAREKAENLRKELSKEVRDEIDDSKRRWFEQVEGERKSFHVDVRKETVGQFNALARKVFKDLADAELEERVVKTFINKLKNFDDAEKENLSKAKSSDLLVECAFDLSDSMRKEITKAIGEVAGSKKFKVDFEVSEDVTCGLQLKIGGWAMLWSLDSYLNALEENLDVELSNLIVTSGAPEAA